jgi:hypothetical protein
LRWKAFFLSSEAAGLNQRAACFSTKAALENRSKHFMTARGECAPGDGYQTDEILFAR